jgi:hypothetical protein
MENNVVTFPNIRTVRPDVPNPNQLANTIFNELCNKIISVIEEYDLNVLQEYQLHAEIMEQINRSPWLYRHRGNDHD